MQASMVSEEILMQDLQYAYGSASNQRLIDYIDLTICLIKVAYLRSQTTTSYCISRRNETLLELKTSDIVQVFSQRLRFNNLHAKNILLSHSTAVFNGCLFHDEQNLPS